MEDHITLNSVTEFSRARFETDERFQKLRNSTKNDEAFFRLSKYKLRNQNGQNLRMNSDSVSAFLKLNNVSAAERIFAEELQFSDLSSLTHTDLEMMGFKFFKEREILLEDFAQLPNQDPTFEELCNEPVADCYNSRILKNSFNHLKNMNNALLGANYKLQLKMPYDVLVGDKYFASHFVVEALEELRKASFEIQNELDVLYKVIDQKSENRKESRFAHLNWILFAAASSASALFAIWYFKLQQ